MINYADYDFYVNVYQGRKMSMEEFQKYILPASAHVRKITFGRADLHKDVEEVKLATCAVCDALEEFNETTVNGQQIASENNDGYSVSYVNESGKSSAQILLQKVYVAAETYLSMTDLLNWGVD